MRTVNFNVVAAAAALLLSSFTTSAQADGPAGAGGYAATSISTNARGAQCCDGNAGGRIMFGYALPYAAFEGGYTVLGRYASGYLDGVEGAVLLRAPMRHLTPFVRGGVARWSRVDEMGALLGAGLEIGRDIRARVELTSYEFSSARITSVSASIVVDIQ